MHKRMVFLVTWILAVCLWLWNIPPAFFAPLIPEMVLIGCSLIIFSSFNGRSNVVQRPLNPFRIAIAIFSALLLESLIRGIYSWAVIEKSHQLCLVMPGIVQKTECIFGAATDQNYSFRTLLTLLTGIFLFTSISTSSVSTKVSVLRGIQFGGVSFALVSYLAHFGLIAIPDGRFDPSTFGRFCYLIGNPSWMAPVLVPSLVAAITLAHTNKKWRSLNILSIAPIADVILRSQQRGGLVVVIAVCMFLSLYLPKEFFSNIFIKFSGARTRAYAIGTALFIFILFIWFMPSIWIFFTYSLRSLGFGDRLANSEFVSSERLIIWRAAWSELKGSFLFGRGYGSWYVAGATQVHKYGLGGYFDTAHNFFVQYLFEHGLISLCLWMLGVMFAVYGLWKSAKPQDRWLLVLIAVCFAPILFFQEVDFLRSGAYLSMAALGAVVGLIPASIEEKSFEFNKKLRWSVRSAGAIFVAMGLMLSFLYSTGGYQYEANAISNYGPRVRWFRQNGRINFVRNSSAKKHQVAIYRILDSYGTRVSLKTIANDFQGECLIDLRAGAFSYLPIAARTILDAADIYRTDKAIKAEGRQRAIMVSWPPVVSTLAVTNSKGAYTPEDFSPYTDDIGPGVWCGKQCELRFLPCGAREQRDISLVSQFADSPANDSLPISLAIGNIRKEDLKLKKSLPIKVDIPNGMSLKINTELDYLISPLDKRRASVFIFGGVCH